MDDKLFDDPHPSAVIFGARKTGLDAAQVCCDMYTESRKRFEKAAPKSPDRGQLAVELQVAKRNLDEAVRTNRGRFKLLKGDK